MAHILKCTNCGATLPGPGYGVVVCEYCKVPTELGPDPAGAAPAPLDRLGAGSRPAPSPAPSGRHAAGGHHRLLELAHQHLKHSESLFYAPEIPREKETGARKSYGERIPEDEPILVLFDSTLFGGADDGFVCTPAHLGWKNLGFDPHVARWEELDPAELSVEDTQVNLGGDANVDFAGSDKRMPERLLAFLRAMLGA